MSHCKNNLSKSTDSSNKKGYSPSDINVGNIPMNISSSTGTSCSVGDPGGDPSGCIGFVGGNIALGLVFPPYGLFLLGACIVTTCCCCGYAAYKSARKNVYEPKAEDPQFVGIQ